MAEVSFGAGQTAVEPTPAAPTQAVAPAATNTAVGKHNPFLSDYVPSMSDVILERINISQALGKLKEAFAVGTLVFGRKTILYSGPDIDLATGTVRRAATPPAVVTFLGITKKRYAEVVPWGSHGLLVTTEAEVAAAGGTLDFQEWDLKKKDGMKRFRPQFDFMVAIKRPDHIKDDGTVFTFDVDGSKWTIGLWMLQGPSYTAACKRVLFPEKLKGCLREGGYPSFSYKVSTRLEGHGDGKESYVPALTVCERNTPAFLEFALSVTHAKPAAAE